MNRRAFITASLATATTIAGCLTPPNTQPSETDTPQNTESNTDADTPILTSYTVAPAPARTTQNTTSSMEPEAQYYKTSTTATEQLSTDDSPEIREFIRETAFNNGERLLFLQAYGEQTCYELTLTTDPSISDTGTLVVEAGVARTAPRTQACGDAITPVTLLLRLTFDPDHQIPDTPRITISGNAIEPEAVTVDPSQNTAQRFGGLNS